MKPKTVRARAQEPTDEEREGGIRSGSMGHLPAVFEALGSRDRDGECEFEKCPHGQMT